MNILLLADPNSVHTIKWATSLAEKSINIFIFGIGSLTVDSYDKYKNIGIQTLNQVVTNDEGVAGKIKYLNALPTIKKIIKYFQPDIMHAHFATSYGLLGALSSFSPFVLSVWGSDVFSFPNKSLIHRSLLKFNLKKADRILSTSVVMSRETEKYTSKEITVTPFGINLEQFKSKDAESIFSENDIVIGTLKSLDERYGIDILLLAFKIIVNRNPELPLKLLIVGGGPLDDKLKNLAIELKIEDRTVFTGPVPFEKIANYHNQMTVTVFVSNSESFGVAVIEASACEKPVVVSNVGGLPEVVEDGVTGFIVPPSDPESTAAAIEKLILDKELRARMGKAGRERVKRLYEWNSNVEQMIDIYNNVLQEK